MANFDRNLLAAETVLFRTRYHWTSYKTPVIWATIACGVGVSLLGAWWYTPVDQRSFTAAPGMIVLGIGAAIRIWVQWALGACEFTVTNQRVRFQTYLRGYDVFIPQIQEVSYIKSPFADYGTLLFTVGGMPNRFPNVVRVDEMATVIEQQVALLTQRASAQTRT
jgi:hypothetical protein